MFKDVLAGVGRTLGAVASGFLIAKGLASAEDAEKVSQGLQLVTSGLIGAAMTAGLSAISKIKAKAKIEELLKRF